MNQPKVSVLMASYNRPELIKNAIESFLKQTYSNAELIICDDCSTDNTLEVIKSYASKYPSVTWYCNQENKNFLPTINWLFSIADGDYVCICDSDDEMAPDRIEHQLSIIEKFNADAVISEMAKIGKGGLLIPNKPLSITSKQIIPDTKEVLLPSGSLMIHQSVIQRVKGYHPYFADAFCGDIYLINTIATEFKLIYDPIPVYYYRLTEGSMTQTFDLYRLSKLELAKRLILQRQKTGTDDLEQNNIAALEKTRLLIMQDKKWRAEQYRLYAARAIDEGQLKKGFRMVLFSFKCAPLSLSIYRTAFYLLRSCLIRND